VTAGSWWPPRILRCQDPQKSSPKTSSQLSPSLAHDIRGVARQRIADADEAKFKQKAKRRKANTPAKKVKVLSSESDANLKVLKLRIYPTREEKKTLRSWMDAVRFTYNGVLESIRVQGTLRRLKDLRELCINNDSPLVSANPWLKATPNDLRTDAMNEVLNAYSTNQAKGLRLSQFVVQYRSRKVGPWTCTIRARDMERQTGVYSFLPGLYARAWTRTRKKRTPPPEIKHSVKITVDRLSRWYICIPIPVTTVGENQAHEGKSVAAIDPGVRTFATVYGTDNQLTEWGGKAMGRLVALQHTAERLTARAFAPDTRARKRYRLRRAALRANERVRNLVTDLHRRLAKHLCETYAVVLLPTFRVSKMVRRKKRRISRATAKAMLTWRHGAFREMLHAKAREYPGCTIVMCNEAYTSKTCTRCGYIDYDLEGEKEYRCRDCHLVIDRDANGARNILLRYVARAGLVM
jgi:putative transposase